MPHFDELEQETFDRLQKLEQGRFQDLGDQLLPAIVPVLNGLRPNGLSAEGKTRPGVPDSFVGDSARNCRAAVEYTTQAASLETKLTKDYESARTECPAATTIVLATNRAIQNINLSNIVSRAVTDHVVLHIIGGDELARVLCATRQDLRATFLNIPLAAHTIVSLRAACERALGIAVHGRYDRAMLCNFVPRPRTDQELRKSAQRLVLVTAPAGMGKTSWSIVRAFDMSQSEPVVWLPTKRLVAQSDPISIAIVQAAFGTPDPCRIVELAQLLNRHKQRLTMFLDAVDEASELSVVDCALRDFAGSALAPHTQVVMTCRKEALEQVDGVLGDLIGTRCKHDELRVLRIRLAPLMNTEAEGLLIRHGVTAADARSIYYSLPVRFRGNPLFLLMSAKLLWSGQVPSGGEQVISSVAKYFVADIRERLKRDGRTVPTAIIDQAIGRLALACLDDPEDRVHPILHWTGALADFAIEDGENSLVARAEAAGLIAVHEDKRCSFSHPLFLEHFASEELRRVGASPTDVLSARRTPRTWEICARIVRAASDPESLLRRIHEVDAVGAAQAATGVAIADLQLRQSLVDALKPLLNSRFDCDQQNALRILGGLRCSEASQAAVTWFNGLSQANKRARLHDAAECFLSLEVGGAASVIFNHYMLLDPPSMPWYEPESVKRVAGLESSFKAVLVRAARKGLQVDPGGSGRCLKFLAMSRDLWIIEHLRRQLSQRLLTVEEHRALVFLATSDAIEVFAESCDMYLAAIVRTPAGDEDGERRRDSMWESTVSRSVDVAMQEHGALLQLVEGALRSPCREIASWALEWAAIIRDPRFLEPSMDSVRRHGLWLGSRVTESVVSALPFARIKEIFDQTTNLALRREIVHSLSRCPGPDTIEFLIHVLVDPSYRFSAAQCLGLLGADSAGPLLLEELQRCDDRDRWMIVRSLGSLRYRPAVPVLIHEIRGPSSSEWAASALGKIGGLDAYEALEELAERADGREAAIKGLCFAPDERAAAVLVRLVERFPEVRPLVVARLALGDPDDVDLGHRSSVFRDSSALAMIVAAEVESQLATAPNQAIDALNALALFESLESRGLLESIAARGVGTGDARSPQPGAVARLLLATRSVEPYLTQAINDQLDRLAASRPRSPLKFWNVHEFSPARVREVLLDRILRREKLHASLFQFQHYVTKDDGAMLATLEQDAEPAIANLAHAMLADRTPRWFDDDD